MSPPPPLNLREGRELDSTREQNRPGGLWFCLGTAGEGANWMPLELGLRAEGIDHSGSLFFLSKGL